MKLSIKWGLLFSFTTIILASVGFIIASSYVTSKNELQRHAKLMMKNNVNFTIDKALKHIDLAKEAAKLTQGLTYKDVLNRRNFKELEKYFIEQLKVNKQFANIYYGNELGDFIMASRDKNGFKIKQIKNRKDLRTVTIKKIDKESNFIETNDISDDIYDPRKRPWYDIANKSTLWTDPYVFFESKKTGITVSSPIYNDEKIIKGVVGVDIELKELSSFLAKLDFYEFGRIFIFDKNLNVVANSDLSNTTHDLVNIKSTKDIVLRSSLDSFLKKSSTEKIHKTIFTSFNLDKKDYSAVFSPFEIDNLKWIIGIYIPNDAYLKDIKENQTNNIFIAVFIALLLLYLSNYLAKKITRPIQELNDIAHKMPLKESALPTMPLFTFSEIDDSLEAIEDMKSELTYYGRETTKLNNHLRDAYLDTLYRLAIASEYKDTDTADHIRRIGEYSEVLAKEMGLDSENLYIIKNASIMHDVGKLGIPDNILLKPGKLTEEEMNTMQEHCLIGGEIFKNSNSRILKAASTIAIYHHEKWDGSGYPYGLSGDKIPIMARIVSIVDVFDALVSDRCYKKAFSIDKALKIINQGKGSHFDPDCVDAFNSSLDKILEIFHKYNQRK